MKKIIALRGRADTGKSSTIRNVYEILQKKYPDAQFVASNKGNKVDVSGVLTINDVKVGIEAWGDPNGQLKVSLQFFVEIDCRVIVCATRTRGSTVDAVNALKKHDYEVSWKQQIVYPDAPIQKRGNLEMANNIVEEVIGLL